MSETEAVVLVQQEAAKHGLPALSREEASCVLWIETAYPGPYMGGETEIQNIARLVGEYCRRRTAGEKR
jgi:hypothetical protein